MALQGDGVNTNVSCIFHTVQLSDADPFPRYRANHRRLIRHVTLGHWSMTLMDIHGTNRHESRFTVIYSFTHPVGTTEAMHEETCESRQTVPHGPRNMIHWI